MRRTNASRGSFVRLREQRAALVDVERVGKRLSPPLSRPLIRLIGFAVRDRGHLASFYPPATWVGKWWFSDLYRRIAADAELEPTSISPNEFRLAEPLRLARPIVVLGSA